jgi:hypothetical protein
MKRFCLLFAVFATVALSVRPAHAWDDFGHRVVARIAWANMTPQVRARAIAILRAAGPETGLRGSVSGTLSQQQQISLFVFAATWPDVVRDTLNPLRMEKYHHPYRHYVDTFWRQDTDFGPVIPVNRRQDGDLLRDVPRLQQWLDTGSPHLKALGLAWILHLVGDIHQPLHASSRISPQDPWGDGGGNTFRVGTRSAALGVGRDSHRQPERAPAHGSPGDRHQRRQHGDAGPPPERVFLRARPERLQPVGPGGRRDRAARRLSGAARA